MSSKQEGGEEPKKEQLDNEVVTNQKGGRQDTASSGAKGEKVEHSDSGENKKGKGFLGNGIVLRRRE